MKKIIALLLSIIMVFCSLPISVFSETLESQPIEENTEENTEATTDDVEEWHLVGEESVVTDEIIGEVSEVTALREENVKHFSLPDGTYEAVVYTQPVHRKDKDGVWQDIDNTIELTTIDKASKYATKDLRVSFADKFTANSNLFTLSENGYSLSMQLLSNGNELDDEIGTTDFGAFSTPTVNNSDNKRNANVFNSLDEAKNIDNRSSIVYNGIRKNTNIEYVLKGNDVKENIIVTAPCKSYEYVFQITLNGLFAELNDNREIFIKDSETNGIKYVIPAPYMYDANGNYSYDVSYTLEQVKDEIYLLAVTADSEWINEENRAFPVVVDPSIVSYSPFVDTYTDSANPNTNYGSATNLWVSNTCTTYIKPTLPTLPNGVNITSAYLSVPYYYYVSTGQLTAAAYTVSSDWGENSLTYYTSPALGSMITTATLSASSSINQNSYGSAVFALTVAVKNWYNGTINNYGIAIKRQESSTATNQSVIIKSGDWFSTYLVIDYTYYVPDGVYSFENLEYDNEWITIENSNCWDKAKLQHKYSTDVPTNIFDRSRLFKISRINSTSRYVIRSMLNNNITLSVTDGQILTKEIPSVDIQVPIEDTFFIEYTGSGFIISPYSDLNYALTISDTSNDISIALKSNAYTRLQWHLERYVGVQQHGFGLYASNYPLAIGNSGTFKVAVWSTEIGYNTPNLSVHESSTESLTIEWNDNTRRGIYELLELGTAAVTVKILNSAGASIYSDDHFVEIIPMQPGTYYMQNAQTQKYVTSDYYDGNQEFVSQNISAGQWTYDNAIYQKWKIVYADYSHQYIGIKSIYSGGYLGVDENGQIKQYRVASDPNPETESEPNSISAYNLSLPDNAIWKIELTQKRNFKFTCKAYEDSGNVLALSSQYDNGARLTYSKYTHNNYSSQLDFDEWYLVKDVISIVNYHDSTFSNNPLFDYIDEAISFANLVYSRYYNVGVYIDGESTYLSDSEMGKCGNNNEKNVSCIKSENACGEDCADHHKNVHNVSDSILDYASQHGGREINHIYTLWTDSPTKMYCHKDHELVSSVALVCQNELEKKKPMIHFINITDEDYSIERLTAIMSLTLVHEMAHVLNMDEIYDERDDHKANGGAICTMAVLDVGTVLERYRDIRNNNNIYTDVTNKNQKYNIYPFCKDCKVLMETNTYKISIQ